MTCWAARALQSTKHTQTKRKPESSYGSVSHIVGHVRVRGVREGRRAFTIRVKMLICVGVGAGWRGWPRPLSLLCPLLRRGHDIMTETFNATEICCCDSWLCRLLGWVSKSSLTSKHLILTKKKSISWRICNCSVHLHLSPKLSHGQGHITTCVSDL